MPFGKIVNKSASYQNGLKYNSLLHLQKAVKIMAAINKNFNSIFPCTGSLQNVYQNVDQYWQ